MAQHDNQSPNTSSPGKNQNHAADQHGDKAHSAFIESLHAKHDDGDEADAASAGQNDVDAFGHPLAGRHRLTEGRQQHDEAEKNSEANRLRR